MAIDPVTAGLIVGGAGALVGGGTNIGIGQANYTQQKHNLEWQQKAQRITWAREDNAVRRRAADLAAAGMSKTLAAGQAAQTGPVVHTQAPQRDASLYNPMTMFQKYADVTQTVAQAWLTKENAEYQAKLNEGKLPVPQEQKLDAEIAALKAAAAEHYAGVKLKLTQQETADYELFMKRLGGFTSQAGWIAGTAGSIIAYTKSNMDQLTNDVKMGKITYRVALGRLQKIEKEAAEMEAKQGKVIPNENNWPRRR